MALPGSFCILMQSVFVFFSGDSFHIVSSHSLPYHLCFSNSSHRRRLGVPAQEISATPNRPNSPDLFIIATMLEANAIRLENVAIRLEAIAIILRPGGLH